MINISAKKVSLIDLFLPFGDRFGGMTQAGVDLPGCIRQGIRRNEMRNSHWKLILFVAVCCLVFVGTAAAFQVNWTLYKS